MKTIRSAIAVAIATAAFVAVASPVYAAPPALPAGDQLTSVSCDGGPATLFTVDSATGSSTAVGASGSELNCAYQGAWDPITGTLYGLIWDNNPILVKYDLATGALTEIGSIVDSLDVSVGAYALAIGLDGTAYINDYDTLYTLDLTTGVATLVGTVAGVTDSAYGFSVDPSTGKLYMLQQSGDLLEINPDPAGPTATLVGTWPLTEEQFDSYGLAIDSAGTAWVTVYPGSDDIYTALYSTPLATFGVDPQLSGNMVDAATADDFNSWWVTLARPVAPAPAPAPQPQLAATGIDAGSIAGVGVLLGVLGFVLVARRRRTV